jgi:predicted transcriptional regulator
MVDWDIIGFVVASNYRRKVVEELSKGVKTPKQISKATRIRINHVSNILSDLSKREVVECKNPDAKVGRLYELTEIGKNVSDSLKKLGSS